MSFFFDFFPIILFFVAYKLKGIFIATAIAIISTFFQVLYAKLKTGKFNQSHLISLASISILGGATIFFQNELFIKWKTTAVYWILALVFWAASLGEKTLMQKMVGDKIEMPQLTWKRLNLSWVTFFGFLGALNLFVAYNFDTDTWVNFKLFGVLGLTVVFFIGQYFFIAKSLKDIKENK